MDNGFDVPAAFDVAQEVASLRYGVMGTPTTYLIDDRGRLVWRHFGFEPGEEVVMSSRVRAALQLAEGGAS